MSLFWRIMLLNASVLVAATALLLFAPVTVSVPVLPVEALVLLAGLAAMLIANGVLLRLGLAPLDRLTRLMSRVDLLRLGQRLPVTGGGEVAGLVLITEDAGNTVSEIDPLAASRCRVGRYPRR